MGQFASQFSGYKPQDAQELLVFVLDGLHEDLYKGERTRNRGGGLLYLTDEACITISEHFEICYFYFSLFPLFTGGSR